MPAYSPPVDETDTQHEGTEHLAINNTLRNRFLTLLALKTTARFYKRDGVCVPISRHKIVKSGRWVHLTEAATMKFVADNTSVPVPKVYCAFVRKNRAYIVMERVQGKMIPAAWRDLSEEDQLRTLKPPSSGVESCVGRSLHDSRIPRARPRFGPFKSIQEFHRWLRDYFEPSQHLDKGCDQEWREIKAMVAKQDGPWPPPVFTHGDLNPSNIVIRGGEVVGIIDWEFSGWYPHYWEYTSAWLGNLTRTGWQDQISEFLDPFAAELEMDKIRHRWWGDF